MTANPACQWWSGVSLEVSNNCMECRSALPMRKTSRTIRTDKYWDQFRVESPMGLYFYNIPEPLPLPLYFWDTISVFPFYFSNKSTSLENFLSRKMLRFMNNVMPWETHFVVNIWKKKHFCEVNCGKGGQLSSVYHMTARQLGHAQTLSLMLEVITTSETHTFWRKKKTHMDNHQIGGLTEADWRWMRKNIPWGIHFMGGSMDSNF